MRAYLYYGTAILALGAAVAHAAPTISFADTYTADHGQEIQQVGGVSTIPNPIPPYNPTTRSFGPPTSPLSQNYTQPSGTYDWGGEATGSATVSTGGNSVATSADAYTTLNGDGTNQYQIRFSSQILLNSVASLPDGFSGSAGGTAQCYLYLLISGLTPGQSYSMHYDWDADYSAGLAHNNGTSQAQGLVQAFVGTIIDDESPDYTTILQTGLIAGEDGEPPPDHTPSGSGDIFFVASGEFMDFEVFTQSVVNGSFGTAFDSESDDLEGATFFGEATFSIETAPEPSALALMLTAALLLLPKRRNPHHPFPHLSTDN